MDKNRYNNICPFDRTRVVLAGSDDYINASHITLGGDTYIAAQAPMHSQWHGPDTRAAFWRCVWENDIHTIAMLAKVRFHLFS
jgi:protein tyrosine phosphatase